LTAIHHRPNPTKACTMTARPIASGDIRPEAVEGTLATCSMRKGVSPLPPVRCRRSWCGA
jgi:hypothetical protein